MAGVTKTQGKSSVSPWPCMKMVRPKANSKILKPDPNPDARHRIKLHDRSISINFSLLGPDLALHGRVSGGVHASQAGRRIACGSGKVERGFGRALEYDAEILHDSEMMAVRDGIAGAKHQHGRRLIYHKLSRSVDRIAGAALEAGASQIKVLAARNGCFGCDLIAVVDQHARADVEPVAQRSYVNQSFNRTETQVAVIVDAVVIEAVAVAETIEASPNVEERRDRRSHISADTQHGYLGYDAEARLE